MRLIPKSIYRDGPTKRKGYAGEKKVFDLLENIDLGPSDITLHSLNMTKHDYQRWCETDFIVISRFGLLLLEVKGGAVSCNNGIWEYSNKQTSSSPATQAKNAFFNLKDNYLDQSGRIKKILKNVPTGFGCVFTDIPRVVTDHESPLPEQGDEITCYEAECYNEKTFKGFLKRLYGHYQSIMRSHNITMKATGLDRSEIVEISKFLRPNFHQVPSLGSSLGPTMEAMNKLTDEQYEKIDFIEGLPRAMIEGGAGTGKTFLATACARDEAALGRKVIFVVRNPVFCEFIKTKTLNDGFSVVSIDEIKGTGKQAETCDVLIIDEAQDLCDMETIEKLDAIVDLGIEGGRWRWFGDSNNQISPSVDFDLTAYEYFKECSEQFSLKFNVRNTPPIVDKIREWTLADMGSPDRYKGMGEQPEIGKSDDDVSAQQESAKKLKRWLQDQTQPGNIGILVPDQSYLRQVKEMCLGLGQGCYVLGQGDIAHMQGNRIVVSSIDDFKGLEREFIIIHAMGERLQHSGGVDEKSLKRLLYQSLSRANHTIFLSCNKQLRARLMELTAQNMQLLSH